MDLACCHKIEWLPCIVNNPRRRRQWSGVSFSIHKATSEEACPDHATTKTDGFGWNIHEEVATTWLHSHGKYVMDPQDGGW